VCGEECDGIKWPSGRPIFLACDKCYEKEEQESKARFQQHMEDAYLLRLKNPEEWLEAAGVNSRYIKCSLENFDGTYPEIPPSFITGPVGTGKTHIAVGYLRRDIINNGGRVQFIRAVDLFKQIRGCFREGSETSEEELMDRYGGTTFLVLDDLGTEKVSDFVEQTLYDLIDLRYAEMYPTIITSNLSIAQVAAHYKNHGDRLASRICGMGEVYEIKAKDRRLARKDRP
jgi:DNA replication protein DnaC